MASVEQITANVLKNGTAQVGAFGANGKLGQTAATIPAALGAASAAYVQAEHTATRAAVDAIRTALIACGICV